MLHLHYGDTDLLRSLQTASNNLSALSFKARSVDALLDLGNGKGAALAADIQTEMAALHRDLVKAIYDVCNFLYKQARDETPTPYT